ERAGRQLEASAEDIRVRHVVLFDLGRVGAGQHREVTTVFFVEQRSEHEAGIETGPAQPYDTRLTIDQCLVGTIADQREFHRRNLGACRFRAFQARASYAISISARWRERPRNPSQNCWLLRRVCRLRCRAPTASGKWSPAPVAW